MFFNLKITLCLIHERSSRPEVLCKKGVLKYIAKVTGKHLCQNLFFNKIAGLRPATLLKETLARVLSCEFCDIFKNNFFIEHLRKTAFSMTYYLTFPSGSECCYQFCGKVNFFDELINCKLWHENKIILCCKNEGFDNIHRLNPF